MTAPEGLLPLDVGAAISTMHLQPGLDGVYGKHDGHCGAPRCNMNEGLFVSQSLLSFRA
jgi:hypothetical protein